MNFPANMQRAVGAAALAVASAFGVEGCGAKTELVVHEPTAQGPRGNSVDACIPNLGPRCSPVAQNILRLSPFAGRELDLRRFLRETYPALRYMPLTDGGMKHFEGDVSDERPMLDNITAMVQVGQSLILGGSFQGNPLVLFYRINGTSVYYSDIGYDPEFLRSMTDWRSHYVSNELHPDIRWVPYYGINESLGSSVHNNASPPGNHCTDLGSVVAMAMIDGHLYVLGDNDAIARYDGLLNQAVYVPGDRTDLCR